MNAYALQLLTRFAFLGTINPFAEAEPYTIPNPTHRETIFLLIIVSGRSASR